MIKCYATRRSTQTIALPPTRMTKLKMTIVTIAGAYLIIVSQITAQAQQVAPQFPGVSRDLASFCSARPSLSIDLATMIIHVKRSTSFNYKLYLFSPDQYVFQTGQIVPRDDFRIHSFPVKLKHFSEFFPSSVPTYLQNTTTNQLELVASSRFNAKRFFAQVPISQFNSPPIRKREKRRHTFDVHDDEVLPGDESQPTSAHDVALVPDRKLNEQVQFDRDDQLAVVNQNSNKLARRELLSAGSRPEVDPPAQSQFISNQRLIMPVGAFSSFHVNFTYLVRKDFDQRAPELIRLQVDAHKFQVTQVDLLSFGKSNATGNATDDFAFLNHKLLRDPNTRITSINQIYEDWITRNYYTIVYIQRRLEPRPSTLPASRRRAEPEIEESGTISGDAERVEEEERELEQEIVTDRLIFRGSSIVLLGADQLEYVVKASAFITEKNGLHYYLEFLTRGKFYLGAIDWTKRPFSIIDSQRFPIKPTQTQFDNEELLLCPPSICYSSRPIDELVSYGRVPLDDKLQHEASILTRALSAGPTSAPMNEIDSSSSSSSSSLVNITMIVDKDRELMREERQPTGEEQMINLDALIESMKLGSNQLETRLHLRDWTWTLPRVRHGSSLKKPVTIDNSTSKFLWHFERARRNDIKASQDTYGFALTGHEIDASYRVYNELYLISANQLITINYVNTNETVTSVHPLSDDFPGLTSTFLDPITAAFYDRYSNQIYFFKGDRYVGYDYATKKPLEDFLLPPPIGTNLPAAARLTSTTATTTTSQPLVSSLPVVGLLGRQHHVDGIYHDLHEDLVHIFTAMKYYTFQASDFKDGAFKSTRQPAMRCINEHFLDGCRFDQAYPNPCRDSTDGSDDDREVADDYATRANNNSSRSAPAAPPPVGRQKLSRLRMELKDELLNSFGDEQQQRLRQIVARGGGLLDYLLLENTLINHGQAATRNLFTNASEMPEPSPGEPQSNAQERIVLYLLMSMVLITILVTMAMICVILSWARTGRPATQTSSQLQQSQEQLPEVEADELKSSPPVDVQRMSERVVYPPAITQYLNNQYHHQRRYPMQYPPSAAAAAQFQPPAFTMRRMGGQTSAPASLPPPLPQSQMFAALQKAATNRQQRHSNIIDSSAL